MPRQQQNQCHAAPNAQNNPKVVVVMIPFPAQGHLNQLLQLSRLLLCHHIPVHYVGTATHIRQAKDRVHGWDPLATSNKIHFHGFQIPPFHSLPPDPNAKIKFPSHLQPVFNASTNLRAPVAALIRTLSDQSRRVVVIHDSLMGYVIQDVSSIPNAESYTFHSVSAFTTFHFIWEKMGKPNKKASGEFIEGVPSLDGCFSSEFLDFIDFQYRHLNSNSGRIYNTSKVIEGNFMELLEQTVTGEKHWALGPFNPVNITPEKKPSNGRNFCLEWLDGHAKNSVIYISFGTTTAISDEQIKEMAIGLKQSGQNFIWVLRDADKGDVFAGELGRRPDLPIGFENAVKNQGLIVRDWAPQLEILAHPATGGFVSHCGWNSCLESITMGVPVGAWPMHSDQPRNSILVTKLLKIGIVIRDWARRDEVVTASAFRDAVKGLMASKEGDEMRRRAAELGDALRQSVSEGGISGKEWDSFIAHINRVVG